MQWRRLFVFGRCYNNIAVNTARIKAAACPLPAALLYWAALSTFDAETQQTFVLAQTLVSQLGIILVSPFQYIVATVLYYDLRVRNEGYDLEMAAGDQTGLAAPAV